jgi:anti-anti-sigma factor
MQASSIGSEHRDVGIHVDSETDGIIAVCLGGEWDMANAPALRDHVDRALESGNDLIVDLSHATFIDSSIIRVLFQGAKAVDGREQTVVLQVATAPVVERALEIVGIERALPRAHSRAEAVEMIQGQSASA